MNQVDASITNYVHNLQSALATKQATEPSYYPALKQLVDSLGDGITATVLPKKIECGAPDFMVTKGQLTIGYIEAKDIGVSLEVIEKSEQLGRYRHSLPNLILTNFLEFRWYQNGERTLRAELGAVTDGKVKPTKQGREKVAQLLADFFKFDASGVGTPKELAMRMARLAHRIREGAEEALNKSVASDMLSGLYQAFQETLIPGLEVGVFADMYAQTIAYGLFAARCGTENAADFSRAGAASLIPKTNPFLRDLFYQITGPDLDDEPYKWAVDELVQLFTNAEMTEVMKGFSKTMGKDDPVVYFYEDFLREYDKKLSEIRGVYYTPIQVVSYIVRSIDYLLKNRFDRPQGLADEKTYILDPATGTGTFLYAVVKEIYDSMAKQGQAGKWDGAEGYVAKHLLPRVLGFELLMAPYVVAHLKLGMELKETGYQFQSKERLGVYLTNTLEQAEKATQIHLGQYIVKEANEAVKIKKQESIMVVLGNPPYSASVFEGEGSEWIMTLLERYKAGLDEKKSDLNREEWKFLRFAEWRIEKTGAGIVGFVINNSFLDGLSTRQMRKALTGTFDEIYVLNLHGSVMASRSVPLGLVDKNVFDIQQGVTIIVMVRLDNPNAAEKTPANVWHAELWGTDKEKLEVLAANSLNNTPWAKVPLKAPYYRFIPSDSTEEEEYLSLQRIDKMFVQHSSGIQTKKDKLAIQYDANTVLEVVRRFISLDVENARTEFALGTDTTGWNITSAQKDINHTGVRTECVTPILYRPFDFRWTYYTSKSGGFLGRPRYDIMRHFVNKKNIGLITMRQTVGGEYSYALVTRIPNCHGTFYLGNKGQDFIFPLYLYPAEKKIQPDKSRGEGSVTQDVMSLQVKREPNLNPEFIKAFSEKLALTFVGDDKGDFKETFGPEDIFNYVYAVFHSPTYRTRYAEFLKIDFPRLPLTSDKELFKSLAAKGAELVSLHLMESPALDSFITSYPVGGSHVVKKVRYEETTQRVYINDSQYFGGMPPEVWEFQVGGYRVCEKWLKDRAKEKKAMTVDDITHYQKVTVVLKETIRLMAEIDSVFPQWPIN